MQSIRTRGAGLTLLAVLATSAWASTLLAADGGTLTSPLPTRYAGFLVATQENATGFGDGTAGTLSGPNEYSIGSELNRLYVTSDLNNVWLGITGNLPNKLANGETIIVLLQVQPDFPCSPPNLLFTAGLPGFGGGYNSLFNLDQLNMGCGFYPDFALAINRATADVPNARTYANAWYFPTNLELPYDDALTSTTPADDNNGLYMSVYMNTTNASGVTATTQPVPDGTGPGTQEELAAMAVKGLRVRLSMNDMDTGAFGIAAFQQIKLAVILMAPDGTVSNQTLPPITVPNAPEFPNCFASTQPVSQGAGTFDPDYFKTVDASYTLYATVTLNNLGAPGTIGKDGSDIPGGFPIGSLVATQRLHTCFGDAQPNPNPPIPYVRPGSELDQLFVRRDETHLEFAVTGNMEQNGNKVYIFIDTGNEPTYNQLTNVGNTADGFNAIRTWENRKFDAGFNPRYVYMVNNSGGTLFADRWDLSIPYVPDVSNPKTYLGSVAVGSGNSVLSGGENPANTNEFALNNSNADGVPGHPATQPFDAGTAQFGLEGRIDLSEIGVTNANCTIRMAVMLSGTDGGGRSFLSNQCLPTYAAPFGNVGADTAALPYNFGLTVSDANFTGRDQFAGNQFVELTPRRKGDFVGDCCITSADVAEFVKVLLGLLNTPEAIYLADFAPPAGVVDGRDIQAYVNFVLSQPPCP